MKVTMSNTIDPRLTMRVGDIVKQPDCEVIAYSANANLRLGGGTAGAVHRAAGPELEAYCLQFRPLGLAQAILTPGFRLPQKIIHVRAPRFEDDLEPEHLLEQAMQSVLALVELSGHKTAAIPALGTGVYRFPMAAAAQIILTTIAGHLARGSVMTEVRLVLASKDALNTFEQVSRLIAQSTSRPPPN